jgi:hypothetical protein
MLLESLNTNGNEFTPVHQLKSYDLSPERAKTRTSIYAYAANDLHVILHRAGRVFSTPVATKVRFHL